MELEPRRSPPKREEKPSPAGGAPAGLAVEAEAPAVAAWRAAEAGPPPAPAEISDGRHRSPAGVLGAAMALQAHLHRALAEERLSGKPEASARAAALWASVLERVIEAGDPFLAAGARFAIWPYCSACYYLDLHAAYAEERLAARARLCDIQSDLCARPRDLLDFLKWAFGEPADGAAAAWLSPDGGRRGLWRSARLVSNAPDLCACDALAERLLAQELAVGALEEAAETLHRLGLGEEVEKHGSDRCAEALRRFGLERLYLFGDRGGGAAVPTELLRAAEEAGEPALRGWIGLDSEGRSPSHAAVRGAMAALAAGDSRRAWTRDAARAVLRRCEGAVGLYGEGEAASGFLRLSRTRGAKLFGASKAAWFAEGADAPDWSRAAGWTPVDAPGLFDRLGVDAGRPHASARGSALWDALAAAGALSGDWRALPDAPGVERTAPDRAEDDLLATLLAWMRPADCGSLTALWLRTGPAGGDPGGAARGRGLGRLAFGLLRDLEPPGVPFEPARFEAVARRLRGTLCAAAGAAESAVARARASRLKDARRGLAERERAIVEFLSDPAGLPFARETADAGGVDHSLADPRLSPTLSGLAAVLGEGFADSLCLASLKALFAIDGAGPASWRLNTRDPEDLGGLGGCRTRSYHSLETAECLAAAMRWLLGSEPCTVSAEPLAPPTRLYLPARPGVRFLLAMAEFIVALNGDAAADQADGVRVTHVAFEHPGVAALTLTQPPKDRLLKFLASRKERMHAPEGLAKTAAFLQGLATATPTLIPLDSLDPGTGSGLTWEHQARFDAVRRLLRHPDLAGETELVTERGAARLLLKWPGFEE